MSEPQAGRNDLVSRILGYMDRPWKAVVVVLLLILIGVGYAAWVERDKLTAVLLAPPHHGLVLVSTSELHDAAARLVTIDQAAMAQVWAFDIRGNAVRFITGVNRDGSPWRPEDLQLPERLPVLVSGGDTSALVSILRGNAVCQDIAVTMPSLLIERLAKAGVRRMCAVPIPPISGRVLAVMIIGWMEIPEPRLQSIGLDSAVELAAKLVSQ